MATLTAAMINKATEETKKLHAIVLTRIAEGNTLSPKAYDAIQDLRIAQREFGGTMWRYDIAQMKKARRAAMKPTSRKPEGGVGTRQTGAVARNDH